MATRLVPLRTVVRAARAADRGFIVGLSEEAKARALFKRAGYAPMLAVGDAYIEHQPACTFTKALVLR